MNRKKIEKLLEMSSKITLDEIIMLSGFEEHEVNEVLSEFEKEKLIRIEQDMVFYLGGFKPKTKENKQQKYEEKEDVCYNNWNEDEIPEWARKRFLIYKKMFNDGKGLEKSNKLKLFIEKFSAANSIDTLTQSGFIEMRELFFEKGEDYFLKNIVLKPLHGLEINNKIYSYYKDEYLDLSRPVPKNALSTAKENFLRIYPEYSKMTFAPSIEFTKRLHKEYTPSEIYYHRNSIVFEEKVPEVKIKKQKYDRKPIICEFEQRPQIIKCFLSDLIYDLQSILINNPELYSCDKIIQGSNYKFKSNNEYEVSKEFNPDKFLDYLVILSHIQSQKQKTNGFTLSSTNEIMFFRGKTFKKETTQNNGSTVRYAIMQELKILSNIYFLNQDKFEPVIEIKKPDKNMHHEFNFYFRINFEALNDKHFIHSNLLNLNPKYYLKAKRLGYYLDFLWQKKDFLKPLCIKELMEHIDSKYFDAIKFKKCKEQTEMIFNMLKEQEIIKNWCYYDWQENNKRDWFEKWQGSHVIIEPSLEVSENYSTSENIINFNMSQLSEFIKKLGINQRNLVKELSIAKGILVKINKNSSIRKESMLKVKAFCELKENLNG